jgi:hypothetical protein
MDTLQITSEPDANPDDVAVIETRSIQFNLTASINRDYRPVVIFLRDAAGTRLSADHATGVFQHAFALACPMPSRTRTICAIHPKQW